jgi:hypothetical protein
MIDNFYQFNRNNVFHLFSPRIHIKGVEDTAHERGAGDVQQTEVAAQPAQHPGFPDPQRGNAPLSGYAAHTVVEEIQASVTG